MKYTRKPDQIDAIQWTLTNVDEVIAFTGNRAFTCDNVLHIETKYGTTAARIGDFILKYSSGEIDVCHGDVFRQKYNPA